MNNHAEANLLALIDSTEDMWGSVDLDYRMVVFNKNFERYIQSCFGVTVTVGMNPAEILPPERAALWPRFYARALTEGAFRVEHALSNGHIFEISMHPILKEGKAAGVGVYGRDITDRKRAEERLDAANKALRSNEARYRTAFNTCLDGFAIVRIEDGQYLEINRAFLDSTGYERQEIMGQGSLELGLWADPEERERFLRILRKDAVCRNFEARFKRKNGQEFWGLISSSLIEVDGQLCQLAQIRDASEAKAAEECMAAAADALRVSEERYRTAFLTSLDGIALTHLEDGLIIEVNPAWCCIYGFERDEAVLHTSAELNLWADPDDRRKMLEALRGASVYHNMEIHNQRKNGEKFWAEMSASKVNLDGIPSILMVIRDNSAARAAEEKIEDLVFFDPLTRLPNRHQLLDRLRQALAASRHSGRKCALLLVDLDNLKQLNDNLGHSIGDMLLREIAKRLLANVRETDLVARLGGDEFAVLLDDLGETPSHAAEQAKTVGEKLLTALAQPFLIDTSECHSTSSIGITIFGDSREEANEVLRQADIAMEQAKRAGRNTLRFFSAALQAAVSARAALEDELRQAIRCKQFLLYYQPQVSRGMVVGSEALIRWKHPQRGILAPGGFIPLAEETGLILELGSWVLETACQQIAAWSRVKGMAHLAVAVNISALQFRQPEFVRQVQDTLKRTGADPRNLKLELTESMLVENIEEVIAKMASLRAQEIGFSLDDFGTGYSSLSYLKRLPLNQLKIDRSFVKDLPADASSGAIAESIISLGKAMGMPVIAEGVETEEQRVFLARLGCHAFQGYLTSRPLPIEEFELLLTALNKLSIPYAE